MFANFLKLVNDRTRFKQNYKLKVFQRVIRRTLFNADSTTLDLWETSQIPTIHSVTFTNFANENWNSWYIVYIEKSQSILASVLHFFLDIKTLIPLCSEIRDSPWNWQKF